jgi:cobalamin biosynthesis protein CobC
MQGPAQMSQSKMLPHALDRSKVPAMSQKHDLRRMHPSELPAITDHGGQLQAATAAFGTPAEGWLDLSTGINPVPYSVPDLAPALWARLPDADLFQAARRAALAYYGAPAHEGPNGVGIVEAPGSQALIQALPRLVRPTRVAVVGFTYAEHERCWRAAGHRVVEVDGIEDVTGASVVVLANPNNPDGRLFAAPQLMSLVERLAAADGLLVVDEAFADVMPESSVAAFAGRPGLCILRSFGKFFGLAGLRLGYALAPRELAAALEGHLGPWRVSGPALEIGRQAMTDAVWIEATRAKLTAAAARLDRLLAGAGLAIIGGTALYRLADCPDAEALHAALARQGILVRRFPRRPRWLRFGLPADDAAALRLRRALAGSL